MVTTLPTVPMVGVRDVMAVPFPVELSVKLPPETVVPPLCTEIGPELTPAETVTTIENCVNG